MTNSGQTELSDHIHRPYDFEPKSRNGKIVNAFSIDVEDYFQVQALAERISPEDWSGFDLRVEANTNLILDRLDTAGTKATFFTLGWVASRCPSLVKRIVDDGHELASHGSNHVRVFTQTADEFREDVIRAKGMLEDLGGTEVKGYRAATFSMNDETPWAHDILEETGHSYSSSLYPVKHDLYGAVGTPRFAYRPSADNDIVEVPMSTFTVGERNFPCGGGGYFRLFPLPLFKLAIDRVNKTDHQPTVFYFHPWEVDPDQPRVSGLSKKSRFRHYVNLSRMEGKIVRLLDSFSWSTMRETFGL